MFLSGTHFYWVNMKKKFLKRKDVKVGTLRQTSTEFTKIKHKIAKWLPKDNTLIKVTQYLPFKDFGQIYQSLDIMIKDDKNVALVTAAVDLKWERTRCSEEWFNKWL
jgi:hypothetical protein